ncbi:4043_t:CDS:2 [Funneliformis caledonium]|uniref:4043_t:CDS:1 n=1 Tax=Funneliformis caledonium TaxID=1117310 RepID=A0A9N9CV49_9GLOM|nr:4043_t:CDS:2 [Funneliformis caledonium]
MLTFERVDQESERKNTRLDEAVEKLKKWEEGKYQGKKLNDGEQKQTVGREEEVGERCERFEEAGSKIAGCVGGIRWKGR